MKRRNSEMTWRLPSSYFAIGVQGNGQLGAFEGILRE
jgi:hypothetical protein